MGVRAKNCEARTHPRLRSTQTSLSVYLHTHHALLFYFTQHTPRFGGRQHIEVMEIAYGLHMGSCSGKLLREVAYGNCLGKLPREAA